VAKGRVVKAGGRKGKEEGKGLKGSEGMGHGRKGKGGREALPQTKISHYTTGSGRGHRS